RRPPPRGGGGAGGAPPPAARGGGTSRAADRPSGAPTGRAGRPVRSGARGLSAWGLLVVDDASRISFVKPLSETPAMTDRILAADSDMHVLKPPDLCQRYIAPEFRHAAPVGMTELRRDLRVKVKSEVLLKVGPVRPLREGSGSGIGWGVGQGEGDGAGEARGWDARAQLEAMDREGMDLAVLFPSRGLFVLALESTEVSDADGLEPEFATAIARAYNDWL